MRRLRVRKLARDEITEAFDWYLARSPLAAQHFLDAVDEAIGRIADAPERHPVIRGRLRRVLLHGYPYAAYLKVYPTVVSVVGVIPGRRHPDTWLRRAAP